LKHIDRGRAEAEGFASAFFVGDFCIIGNMDNGRSEFLRHGLRDLLKVVTKETKQGFAEIDTEYMTFYPIYAGHREGFLVGEIPDETTHFFREFTLYSEELGKDNTLPKSSLKSLLMALRKGFSGGMDYLAKKGIPLVLGDVVTPENAKETESWVDLRADIGLVAIGAGMGMGAASLLSDSRVERYIKKEGVTRRQFLKLAALGTIGAGLWSASGKPFDYLGQGDFDNWRPREKTDRNGLEEMTPQERLIIRAYAIQSHFHPEVAVQFFRNLVMAHKIMSYAQEPKSDISGKPYITGEFGGAHGGIEDMIRAGKVFCLQLMKLMYTRGFFEKLMEINYGADNFAAIRVVNLDPSGNLDRASDHFYSDNELRQLCLDKTSK